MDYPKNAIWMSKVDLCVRSISNSAYFSLNTHFKLNSIVQQFLSLSTHFKKVSLHEVIRHHNNNRKVWDAAYTWINSTYSK